MANETAPVLIAEIDPAADTELARLLLAIQHAAYSIEADVIGDRRIPPLHEDLESLRSAALEWLGCFDGPTLVGALAWTMTSDEVDIDRLVVAPEAQRRGVGTQLVRHLLKLAGQRRTTVATGRANLPARRLYERLGFALAAEREVQPGLWLACYRRE